VRGEGSKLGKPCPNVWLSQDKLSIEPFEYYIWDYYIVLGILCSVFLRSGLFCSGKVRGASAFGNMAKFESTYSLPHPSLPAQTTCSYAQAHEASLPHPPHSDHLDCAKKTGTRLGFIRISSKR